MKTRQVIGWKHEPQAWWPELPGKDMPKGWNPSYRHAYDKATGKHTWALPESHKEMKIGSTVARKRAGRGLERVAD